MAMGEDRLGSFLRNLGVEFVVAARLVIAFILTGCCFLILVCLLGISACGDSRSTKIYFYQSPVIKVVVVPSAGEVIGAQDVQRNHPSVVRREQVEANSANLGAAATCVVRITALLAALGGMLWAIVLLTRVE